MADVPAKPNLALVFEDVARVMGLAQGVQRLELIFEDGRLRQWWRHDEKRSPAQLRQWDEPAALLPLVRDSRELRG